MQGDKAIRNDGRLRLERNLQSESNHFNLIEVSMNHDGTVTFPPVEKLEMSLQRSIFERVAGVDVREHAKWIGQSFSDVIARFLAVLS